MLLFVALTGLGFQYLWPDNLFWHQKSQAVIIPIAIASAISFNRSFLALHRQAPRLDKIGYAIFALSAALVFLGFAMPYSLTIKLDISLLFPGCGFALFTGIHLWKRGYKPARYYVISWGAIIIFKIIIKIPG